MSYRNVVLTVCCVLGLSACVSAPFPALPVTLGSASFDKADAIVAAAREAHGAKAYASFRDINVSYAGDWSWLVTKLQPVLTDARYRGVSQERLLPPEGIVAQRHAGAGGVKQVLRDAQQIQVAYDGAGSSNAEVLDAAAMVTDAYSFFLLGPLVLDGKGLRFTYLEEDTIDGRVCDVISTERSPGLGRSKGDKLVFWFDRETHLMRRVRFSLNGMESTQGAVAEVEVAGYISRFGMQWPTRFVERLIRPIPGLTVHQWKLTGLDVNRGYLRDAVGISGFSGVAAVDAATEGLPQ